MSSDADTGCTSEQGKYLVAGLASSATSSLCFDMGDKNLQLSGRFAKPEQTCQAPSTQREVSWLLSEPRLPGAPGTWKPLSEPKTQIRLLFLLPGAEDEPISAELYTFDRNTIPDYIAMSYRWGDDNDNESLTLNGRILSLTRNCYYALWQARTHYGGSLIWIDSICIDQANLQERGHQVKVMGEIYASAKLVVVCIGTGTADVDIITALAPELESCDLDTDVIASYIRAQKTIMSVVNHSQDSPTIRFMQRSNSSGLASNKLFRKACLQFAKRLYWERLWIVQELVMSRDKVVLCGPRAVSWRLVPNLLVYNNNLHGPMALLGPHPPLQHLGQILQPIRNVEGETSPFATLCLFKCFDPRDRVYGTLAFVDWASKDLEIYPDYDRSEAELALLVLEKRMSRKQNPHDLFRMLGLDGKNKGVRHLIRKRLDLTAYTSKFPDGVKHDPNSLVDARVLDEPPQIESDILTSLALANRMLPDTLEGFPRLEASVVKLRQFENKLYARLWPTGSADMRSESDVLYERLVSILDTRRLGQASHGLTYGLCQRPPRNVLFRDDVAALVCYEALAGDYLIQLGQWQQDSHCLVVRRMSHQSNSIPTHGTMVVDTGLFKIIGQALLLDSRLSSLQTIRINMSSLDWLIWRVQDIRFTDPLQFSFSGFKEDPRRKLERLVTSIDGEVDLLDSLIPTRNFHMLRWSPIMTASEAAEYGVTEPTVGNRNAEEQVVFTAGRESADRPVFPRSSAVPFDPTRTFSEIAGLAWSSPSVF